MKDIWREKVNIRFGDVDSSSRLTLGSVFSFFQEAAISHAADLGVGIKALENPEPGFPPSAWILSRLSLFVSQRPAYGETVQVSTWPRQWEKLFALRDYEIKDEEDSVVVRGRACWLIIDVEKRKPLRIQPILASIPANEGIDALPAGSAGLAPRETFAKKSERAALYSDIDNYGHMNNARYIQWIQDATEPEILTSADQARLDINYLSEVKPGETVELWTAPLRYDAPGGGNAPSEFYPENFNPEDYPRKPESGFAYEGRRPDTGQAVFRAELRTGSR